VAIIGNVEFDHADIYADLPAVQTAFVRLLNVVPRRGTIIAGIESPALAELLPRAHSRVETFGLNAQAHWQAVDLRVDGTLSRFRLLRAGRDQGEFALCLPGEHNVRNAVAALAAAAVVGVEPDTAREALRSFRGVKRRLELRGRNRGVAVYDDFAHHPTAVRETLRALRASAGQGRLVAVFEPRSYTSRTRVFQEAFAQAFAIADYVVVAAAHLPGKVPEGERLSERDLVSEIVRAGAQAVFIPGVSEIVEHLAGWLRDDDCVAVLSNGGFGAVHERLLAALAAPPA